MATFVPYDVSGKLFTPDAEPILTTFTLSRKLGWGGAATVYDVGEKLALKIFDNSYMEKIYFHDLIRELNLNRRLVRSHVNAVEIKGVLYNEETKMVGFLMEKMPVACSKLTSANLPIYFKMEDRPARYHVIAKIVNAVATLHHNGFVHGDLKLGNMCLDSTGEVKFIDLSFASVEREDWFRGAKIIPTELYGAADINNTDASPMKTECYSLGVSLLTFLNLGECVPSKMYRELSKNYTVTLRPENMLEIVTTCIAQAELPQYEVKAVIMKVIRGLCHPDHTKRMTTMEAARLLKMPVIRKRKRVIIEEKQAAENNCIMLATYEKMSDMDIIHYMNTICHEVRRTFKPPGQPSDVLEVCTRLNWSF